RRPRPPTPLPVPGASTAPGRSARRSPGPRCTSPRPPPPRARSARWPASPPAPPGATPAQAAPDTACPPDHHAVACISWFAMADPQVSFEVHREPDQVRLAVTGDLDLASSGELAERAQALIPDSGRSL